MGLQLTIKEWIKQAKELLPIDTLTKDPRLVAAGVGVGLLVCGAVVFSRRRGQKKRRERL